MDEYGVITIGDHLLSIPGLLSYLLLVVGWCYLVSKWVTGIPKRYRWLNLISYWLSVAAIIGWIFIATGLSFYVKA